MNKLTKTNYPPLLVLWLLAGCASTLIGAVTNNMVLLGGGAGSMLLEVAYILNWKSKQGRSITV